MFNMESSLKKKNIHQRETIYCILLLEPKYNYPEFCLIRLNLPYQPLTVINTNTHQCFKQN